MSPQVAVNALVSASNVLLLGIGFWLIYFSSRVFHVAHGSANLIGAYVGYVFASVHHLPLLIAALLGGFAAAAFGISCEFFLYEPIRRYQRSPLVAFVASLGLVSVASGTISLVAGNRTLVFAPVTTSDYRFEGFRLTAGQLTLLLGATFAGLACSLVTARTSVGRGIRAVQDDQELALAVGIHVDRILLISFGLGSFLAGSAGVLWSNITAVTPQGGFGYLLQGITAALVAGPHGIPAVIAMSLCITSAQQLALWWLPAGWADATVFFLLLIALVLDVRRRGSRDS